MARRSRSAFAAALFIALGVAPLPVLAEESRTDVGAQTAQARQPECVCRAQGRTFAVGESACLRTPTGARVALCGMVQNNTSWHFTEQPCPES
jgi:hypothetical protein